MRSPQSLAFSSKSILQSLDGALSQGSRESVRPKHSCPTEAVEAAPCPSQLRLLEPHLDHSARRPLGVWCATGVPGVDVRPCLLCVGQDLIGVVGVEPGREVGTQHDVVVHKRNQGRVSLRSYGCARERPTHALEHQPVTAATSPRGCSAHRRQVSGETAGHRRGKQAQEASVLSVRTGCLRTTGWARQGRTGAYPGSRFCLRPFW